jgi:GT2 family glycosyltransferase
MTAPQIGPTPRERASRVESCAALVSLVIVSLNGRAHLARCLPAVLGQTRLPDEVVVVDNGSTDGTPEYLAESFPAVRVIRADRNLGFAAGVNRGIRASDSEWVATLNNDTEPEPDWLAEMLRAADAAEAAGQRVGMVASRMLRWDEPGIFDSAGICLDRAGIAWDRLGGQRADGESFAAPLLGPCAGAALYRREMLDEVGAFDERFFLYLEDVDLAWRARLAGWTCADAPAARARHRHSATAGEDSPLKRYHLGRNKLWLIAKDYPAPLVYLYLPVVLAYDLAAAFGYFFAPPAAGTPWRSRIAALRGRLAGLTGLGEALRARRTVQQRRRVSGREAREMLAPIEAPWRAYARFRR